MNFTECMSIIEALTVKSRYSAEIPRDLIKSLMDNVTTHNQPMSITDLRLVSNLITKMSQHKMFSDKEFKLILNKYSVDFIEELNDQDFSTLCEVLSKIGMQNKYFDVMYNDDFSIYKVIENKVKNNINRMQNDTLFKVLKCLVINDRGDEDLIRQLEKRVFDNLKEFSDKELADIPYFYHKRVLFPYNYLIENIYKKTYEEFTNRFESVNPLSKSLFLINYWKNSTFHGMYCDNQLTKKIKKELFAGKYESVGILKTRQHAYSTCLSYMAHARQLDLDTIDYYVEKSKKNKNRFGQNFFLRSAIYLSRYPGVNPEFWQIFKDKFKASAGFADYASLYCIWLNCKLRDPVASEIVKDVFTPSFVEKINKEWRIHRNNDIKSGESSHVHREIVVILQKLKVDFVTEHYDEYFIDLAIPDIKVGIEIVGPGHYLFPQFILNGKSENKKITLEKLGWKMYYYSFFHYSDHNIGVKDFVHSILPLDF